MDGFIQEKNYFFYNYISRKNSNFSSSCHEGGDVTTAFTDFFLGGRTDVLVSLRATNLVHHIKPCILPLSHICLPMTAATSWMVTDQLTCSWHRCSVDGSQMVV